MKTIIFNMGTSAKTLLLPVKRIGVKLLLFQNLFLAVIIPATVYGQNSVLPQENLSLKEYRGSEANEKILGASFVKVRANSKFPSIVRFERGKNIYLNDFQAILKFQLKYGNEYEFKLNRKRESNNNSLNTYRYKQYFKGIPILNSVYTVYSKNNILLSYGGIAYDLPINLSEIPMLDEATALNAAKHSIGAEKYYWEIPEMEERIKEREKKEDATYFPRGELTWFNDETPEADSFNFILAYRFDILASIPLSAYQVYVDANSGAILQSIPLESNCHATTVKTIYDGDQSISTARHISGRLVLQDDCGPSPFIITVKNANGNSDTAHEMLNDLNTWNNSSDDTVGTTALWAVRECYDYFRTHGLHSYDNLDGPIEVRINDPTRQGATMNATDRLMRIGRTPSSNIKKRAYATLDIIGHEFTHAVTKYSTALVNVAGQESGALNEGFSDIFGEALERSVRGNNDWIIGGDRGDTVRNMKNPHLKGSPQTYRTDPNWDLITGKQHINACVLDYWFYLLCEGDFGVNSNGMTYIVAPIGFDKAIDIAFEVLTFTLPPNATYNICREKTLEYIREKIFNGDWPSDVERLVIDAWHAVGVGGPSNQSTGCGVLTSKIQNQQSFFSKNRPVCFVLIHGITATPETSQRLITEESVPPFTLVNKLTYSRYYWTYDFVSGLLGSRNLFSFSNSLTALNASTWEKQDTNSAIVSDHFISVNGIPDPLTGPTSSTGFTTLMFTYRNGSKSFKQQTANVAHQIKELYDVQFCTWPDEKKPQLVLICHSGGGIVARTICSKPDSIGGGACEFGDQITKEGFSSSEKNDMEFVRNNTMYIITLATPHEGSTAALNAQQFVNPFDQLIDGAWTDLHNLDAGSPALRELCPNQMYDYNRGPLLPCNCIRSDGSLVPIYCLGGRTPGGPYYYENPNNPMGGILAEPASIKKETETNNQEFEAFGLVRADYLNNLIDDPLSNVDVWRSMLRDVPDDNPLLDIVRIQEVPLSGSVVGCFNTPLWAELLDDLVAIAIARYTGGAARQVQLMYDVSQRLVSFADQISNPRVYYLRNNWTKIDDGLFFCNYHIDGQSLEGDGVIDSDGFVPIVSALGVNLGTTIKNYFSHETGGNFYRFYRSATDWDHHGSITTRYQVGKCLRERITKLSATTDIIGNDAAGPYPATTGNVSVWTR